MNAKRRKWFKFRLFTALACFLLFFVVLLSRAFQLQVISGNHLKSKAETQHIQTFTLHPDRGNIIDRNGRKLAATLMVDSICADPKNVIDRRRAIRKISSIVSIPRREMERRISKKGNFSWIARRVTPSQAKKIGDLNLEGIYIIKEPKRFYPNRELASHLLGIVGYDSKGLEGLELRYDDRLKREGRRVSWKKDARGRRIFINDESPDTEKKYNLILTIDANIQYMVESKLIEASRKTGAKRGTAVVMDVRTGGIIAMANVPTFNGNNFGRYDRIVRKNSAVMDCFEPGSVFKPFLVAAAIEEGAVSEDDVIDCEDGSYRIGRNIIHEAFGERFKELAVRDVLRNSSNIGAVKIGEMIGKDLYFKYLKKFGFGAKTGIKLPGETEGILRTSEKWKAIDFASMTFGQSVSVTAIQLVTAMSAIANSGVLMKPRIVKGVIDERGNVVEESRPKAVRRIISEKTARKMASILADVVEDGTGSRARISGVPVAGKTGTSQKYDSALGRYSSEKVVASFVGFFPADDPQVCVFVHLDEPESKRWGGKAAAPLFAAISKDLIYCFNNTIEPREVAEVEKEGTIDFIKASVPEDWAETTSEDLRGSPDFRGMTVREVLRKAGESGIDVRIMGSGIAVSQKAKVDKKSGKSVCYILFDTGS